MEKKAQKNENPKRHAASACTASCSKCQGTCSLGKHDGQHKCKSGHSWSQ